MAVAAPERAAAGTRVSSGPHFSRFCRTLLRHTMQVPNGPAVGAPFALEPYQDEFWDEALELEPVVDDAGETVGWRRVYSRAGKIVSRKNGKTSELGAFAIYTAGPWDGEYRPTVILAAGSKDQAGELVSQVSAFIDDPNGGSRELQALFVPRQVSITCPSTRGVIRRVAGDGKLNHSLNPHVVIADELHAWKTKRQKENWKALTTAQGARVDPLVVFITSEGEDEDDELFDLLERITNDPLTEVEVRNRSFTIYRNRSAGMLVYKYGCPPDTPLTDLETIKLANPASWRTEERLREDLADPLVDENTKRRLYMGIRTAGPLRWISDAKWDEAFDARTIPAGVVVTLGADGARFRDTTAVGWAWIDPSDGVCLVDAHVWACRPGVACDSFVEGGRLDNDETRDYILNRLGVDFSPKLLFYDERFFGDQAADLSAVGLVCVEMHQGKPEMQAAWDEFYAELHEGKEPTVRHNGNKTLYAHIRAANGKKTPRGWRVTKDDRPNDAVAAAVMARYGARHFADFQPRKPSRLISW